MNSRNKGKRGELEFVRVCRAEGFQNVRRAAQYCGNTGEAADVVGLRGIHAEIKRVEHLNIYDAMDQSRRDARAAGKGEIPIVAFRKNNAPWLIVMDTSDFFKFYREFLPNVKESGRNELL